MERHHDEMLSLAAASTLLRVGEQTLRYWIACGAFSQGNESQTGVAVQALLEVLYRQPGHQRAFERGQVAPAQHRAE
jgi:hypothetical protein